MQVLRESYVSKETPSTDSVTSGRFRECKNLSSESKKLLLQQHANHTNITDKDKHKIKTLRKENDLLKRRLGDLRAEFKSIKNKMVEQNKSQSNVASVSFRT